MKNLLKKVMECWKADEGKLEIISASRFQKLPTKTLNCKRFQSVTAFESAIASPSDSKWQNFMKQEGQKNLLGVAKQQKFILIWLENPIRILTRHQNAVKGEVWWEFVRI